MTKQIKNIDLAGYKRDSSFYEPLDLLLTVKSFNLQEIRKRYLKSLENKGSKRGSVERRASAMGGIVLAKIENGRVTQEQTLKELLEPRGIAIKNDVLALSSEKKVFLISNEDVRSFSNPWFSYIHTVNFNNAGDRILVSSSGFDALFEYDIESLRSTYEWFAWEHGLNKGSDPESGNTIFLSRSMEDLKKENFKVIKDPLDETLPTAMRAAFINSVEYDDQDNSKMLATLF
ncbi:MAG: hypothetical protein HKN22_08320, partial [Bacteroidia bacterium]|nr:hypothetical protein [Bacteroidia bacterium]